MISKAITKYVLTKLEPGFFASFIYYINAKTISTLLKFYLSLTFLSSVRIVRRNLNKNFACYNGRYSVFYLFYFRAARICQRFFTKHSPKCTAE